MTDWNKLKVPELKAELKKRGLPQTGLKAALVARLTTTENESGFESEATLQDDLVEPSITSQTPTNVDTDTEVNTQSQLEGATIDSPNVAPQESPKSSIPASSPTLATGKTISISETETKFPSDADVLLDNTSDVTPKSGLQPGESQEVAEDILKRKRRSQSPPPTESDAPRKRARQDRELPLTDIDTGSTGDGVAITEDNAGVPRNADRKDEAPPPKGTDEDVQSENQLAGQHEASNELQFPKEADSKMDVADDPNPTATTDEESASRVRDSRFKELFPSQQMKANQESLGQNTMSPPEPLNAMDVEPDRYVTPSIHPATTALYIRDMMRPLNANAWKDHLTTLAAPPGTTPDPTVIIDFFLDPIRTHSFISFTNISAASRVRSELHERIWPDERTRKPLWVDFVPPEKIQGWIEEEQASGASRQAAKKWEVGYNFVDGDLIVSLEEVGVNPVAARKASLAPVATRPTVPVPPGIQWAPSGPRAQQSSAIGAASSSSALDQLFKSTVAKPVLYYQPVSKELADKRLDKLDVATSKHYSSSHGSSEINRYTFEDHDILVDRGPEIFSGIRPPPGYRGRGGGGGYRGSRGGGRGGDRYDGRRRDDWNPRDRERRYQG